jgi:hypothetical protein
MIKATPLLREGIPVTCDRWDREPEDNGADHRRFPRLACGGIADVRVLPNGEKETGTLINLSKVGCCFLSDLPLRAFPGSQLEVHLKVKGTDLRVAAVIRHIRDRRRAGIEFVEISERKRDQIEDLITELVEMDQLSANSRQNPKTAQEARLFSIRKP